jgi:hypothetical protein
MLPSLFLAFVLLSPPSQVLCAFLTVTAAAPSGTLQSSRALYWTDNPPAKGSVVDAGLLERTAGPADSSGAAGPPGAVLELHSFALYALSRGRGVSESGQKAMADFRELLRNMKAEGHAVEVSDKRIGIEGETRICASFASPELAGKAWLQMQRSLAGADLVQLKPEKCAE